MFSFLLSLLLLLPHPPVLAVSLLPTPVASPSAIASPSGNPVNLDEIQKIRQAVQDKVKEKLQEIVNSQNKKKGLVGSITTVDNATITINLHDSEKIIITDDSTVIIDINRKRIDTSKLKVGQSILAMGYENQEGALMAKRIVVNDPDFLPIKKIITIGKIVDRSLATNAAVLIPSNNKNNQYQISLNDKTSVSTPGGQKLQLKDVAIGKKVIVVLNPESKTKSLTAESVYIVE